MINHWCYSIMAALSLLEIKLKFVWNLYKLFWSVI
uniref:Uncharacterized protein n=1 Tax=Anguilla anguilla TaxID=7936 RepID=A0A0E9QKZ1_ANGAN